MYVCSLYTHTHIPGWYYTKYQQCIFLAKVKSIYMGSNYDPTQKFQVHLCPWYSTGQSPTSNGQNGQFLWAGGGGACLPALVQLWCPSVDCPGCLPATARWWSPWQGPVARPATSSTTQLCENWEKQHIPLQFPSMSQSIIEKTRWFSIWIHW